MKFKDVRTLDAVLSEYGMKPGASTPTSQQSTGANAKANATSPTVAKKTPPKKDLGSPTTTPGLDVKEPEQEQEPKFTPIKAKDIDVDAEYHDDKGNVIGKVISKVGDTPNPDKVVVQDPKGEYQLVDPDEEVQMLNASKLSKLSKSTASSFNIKKQVKNKKNKLKKIKKKMKKLVRKFKLREQGEEQLFEINFNQKSVAKEALDLPIKCGFEAETSWEYVYGGGEDDDDWLYEYNWYDIEDFISDQEGRSSVQTIEDSYNEFIDDKAMDLEGEMVEDIVSEREEDEVYLNDFIESELSEDDIEEYKERILDDLPEEDHDEYADWDFMNWGRQYVEEELLDDYKEWLADNVRDEGEAMDRAYDEARDRFNMDEWADYEYGSWNNCLSEHGIYLYNPDNQGGGQQEVADYIENWAQDNSKTSRVDAGDYHAGYGDTKQSYWRVEGDPSIDSGGTGSEIISPVYDTPGEMLKEMKSLFEFLQGQDVETNRSTGLHVTMSMNDEPDAPMDDSGRRKGTPMNKVKMAVLLGDKYLLSTFGRKGNTYAKSQYDNLKRMGAQLKSNPDNLKNIKAIEEILSQGISSDKYSAINFKGDTDRDSGNELIEFRIGGGDDYHRDYNNAAKAVIRYATIMRAGASDKKFNKDYAKALFSFINKLDQIDADTEERAKGDIEHPAIDVLKDFFAKDNYVNSLHKLNAAFNSLEKYKKMIEPGADEKWKKQVRDFEKATGQKVSLKEQEPIRGYLEPDPTPPSKRADSYMRSAQNGFLEVIYQAGYDLNQNLNRKPVSAKGIGILRKTLKDFEIDYAQIDQSLNALQGRLEYGREGNSDAKTRMQRIKNGVDRLFKKDIITMPSFLTDVQVDKIVNGLWNAHNSGELKDNSKASKEFYKVFADAKSVSTDQIAGDWNELLSDMRTIDFPSFSNSLTRGHIDSVRFRAGEPINASALEKFFTHLKKYPQWNHPVTKDHNPTITGGDSYTDNALSKMMMKMRNRFDAVIRLKDDDPAKYYDTIKKLVDMGEKLLNGVKYEEGQIAGLDADDRRSEDGPNYFGMHPYSQEKFRDMLDAMANTRPDPMGGNTVEAMKNRLQDYIRDVFDRYYNIRNTEPEFYEHPVVKKLVKQRMGVIKTFLSDFDKIAQDMGFDSQSKAIAKKNVLDKKQKQFKKTHGPKNLMKIKSFSFGGDLYVQKRTAQKMLDNPDISDRQIYDDLVFSKDAPAGHLSHYYNLAVVPHSDYYLAAEAEDIIGKDRFRGTWREDLAKKIMTKWYDRYKTTFADWKDYYEIVNSNTDFGKWLKSKRVEVTDELGDGRVGMKGFGDKALGFEKESLVGKYGEPFGISAAASWHVNNPELSKKIKAEEEKRRNSIDVQIPINAGVEDMKGEASNSIAMQTNWNSLARYLKIDLGVNDQGVTLLKKTYEMFDGNSSGEFAAEGHSMARYVDAVKKAKAYIEKNYTVSGGNYFRDEDYIGSRLGGPETASKEMTTTEDDYETVRTKYIDFDRMMKAGMQNYMVRPDVNRLVDFLKNPDNEEDFKKAVLQSMMKEKLLGAKPNDFQGHLAKGRQFYASQVEDDNQRARDDAQRARVRMLGRESVFDKFDKLPLEEKIRIIEQSEILNEIDWSKVKKGVAGAALAGTLATAPMDAKADNVGADTQLSQPVATQQADTPDNAPKGKVLHGKFTAGMSIEDVKNIAPGGKIKDEYKEFRGVQGGTVKYKINGAPGENSKANTYFGFDDNNKLSSVHFVYQVHNNKAGPFFQATKGEGLFGRKWGELGFWFKKAYNLIPNEIKSAPSGKASTSRGGEFGLGFGGVTKGGTGIAIGLDKTGSAMVRIPTQDGQVTMSMRTQKGVVNNFHIMGMTITKVADDYDSPFDISERPLTKGEKSDKEKYVKGMKKNKGDFEKRYGKDAKAVMYATATKMAKESVNDFNQIDTINKLLADHFPVGDLKKQMLAFQAIPVPAMLDAFRDLRAEAGDDACARNIVRMFTGALPKEQQARLNLNEWSKQHIKRLLEAKGLMGRVAGDRFQRGDDTLEFSGVVTYPQDRETFDDAAERDSFIADIEQQLNAQIEWTNNPNSGTLAFAIAELTDPALNDKPTFWGRYFRKAGADMMGKWGNSQVPTGWKLQKAGALKLDIGIDPQHLIKNENIYNGIDEVIGTVAKNSQGHEIQQELLNGLTSIKNQEHPVFEGQIKNLPALRDYFGEIMGPVALMAGMVGGQAEDARQELMNGAEWSSYGVKWPQEMNFALVDSIFVGPDGTEVGISSKGGKGARASAKNISDAIEKASDELKQTHAFTVQVLNIIQSESAAQGPFRLAEFLNVLPAGLEKEILTYAKEGKTDYEGLSEAAQELFSYGTPRQDVPGFNTGYALIALLAKKVAKLINENPGFGSGCLAFLNQSSIVQLYCKMGKQGENARVTGWDAVYPPNFQGTVVLDGSKNYYSSRIGGKFAFGFV